MPSPKSSSLKSSSLTPVRRRSIEEEVYLRMREAILSGEMAGGDRLIHEELAGRFGTSRIPVRDALRRLQADGLVETDSRGIYTVTPCAIEDVEEIYSLRALLEARAVALATPHLSKADLAELNQLQQAMDATESSGDVDSYVALNQQFHHAIYEAARQPRLLKIITSLWQGLPPLTPLKIHSRVPASNREHHEILSALAEGDAKAAAAAMARHIDNAGIALRDYIAEAGGQLR